MPRLPPGGTRIGQAGGESERARERERGEREITGYEPFDRHKNLNQ